MNSFLSSNKHWGSKQNVSKSTNYYEKWQKNLFGKNSSNLIYLPVISIQIHSLRCKEVKAYISDHLVLRFFAFGYHRVSYLHMYLVIASRKKPLISLDSFLIPPNTDQIQIWPAHAGCHRIHCTIFLQFTKINESIVHCIQDLNWP